MFCKYCGKTINADQKFCTYCGKKVAEKNDLKNGETIKIDLSCPKCHGDGFFRTHRFGIFGEEIEVECKKCDGTGEYYSICPDCNGSKIDASGQMCSLCKGQGKIAASNEHYANLVSGKEYMEALAKHPIRSVALACINFFVMYPLLAMAFVYFHETDSNWKYLFGTVIFLVELYYPSQLWDGLRIPKPLTFLICVGIVGAYLLWGAVLTGYFII